jgi:hypothetical protein
LECHHTTDPVQAAPLALSQGFARAFCSCAHYYLGQSMVSLQILRVGALRASLRFPSYRLPLMIQAWSEVSVAAKAVAIALWASLHSKPGHRISGSQLERSSASVNRTRFASFSPSSVSTQLP